jgi:cytochrome P450
MSELLPFYHPAYVAAPHPYWDRLRDEAPVHWNAEHGFWALTRYDDVVSVLHDPARFSSACGPSGGVAGEGQPFLPMIQNDPPDHERLRRILSRAFVPRIVAEREPRIRAIGAELLQNLRIRAQSGESVDLVEHFASPLPVSVIAEILGIPPELRERLKLWSDATTVTGAARVDDAYRPQVMGELYETLAALIEERRRSPRDDLFSWLIAASESDASPLRRDELVGLCLLLWLAGNETTTNLISNVALLLQERKDLCTLLRERPECARAFVEEALRLETPVNGLFRQVQQDLELRGEKLREGDRVFVMFAAANRDPRHFRDPARFDLGRSPNDHVAFGHGIHFCLGSHLARLEARVAFEGLAELLQGATLAPERGARIPVGNLKGWLRLPLEIP